MTLRDEWQKLANELGFEFLEGPENVLKIPAVQLTMKKELGGGQMTSVEKALANTLLSGVLSKMFIVAVSGRFLEREFVLFRNIQSF